jgi:hypothetical protein
MLILAGGIVGALLACLQLFSPGQQPGVPGYAFDPVLISYAYFEKDGIQVSMSLCIDYIHYFSDTS